MSQEKKNEEVKMTGFFQSLKSVLLTAKVIFRMDWKNIPAFVGNQIFLTVQPFVALFFPPGFWTHWHRGRIGGRLFRG